MTKQVRSRDRVADHGEVFTAEREVKAMCDLVEAQCNSVDATFLEPACGDGNFLTEILGRKLARVNKEAQSDTAQWERLSVRAIASLYGVDILQDNVAECRERLFKQWNTRYTSACKKQCSEEVREAVRYLLSKNIVCGNALTMLCVDESRQDTDEYITFAKCDETAARVCEFARTSRLVELFNMHFDVVICNPPYQTKVNEVGKGLGAVPIYHKFIELAQKLDPQYISMIVPARWFSGGVGLTSFRKAMLKNRHIRRIVDYVNSKECFPGVDVNGGICYFLIDKAYAGDCYYTSIHNGKAEDAIRQLDEFDIFIRHSEALSIVRKVAALSEKTLAESGGCSPQTPYGFLSTYIGKPQQTSEDDCELLSSKGWSFVDVSEITRSRETVTMYKPMISKLSCEHAGNPDKNGRYRVLSRMELLKPKQICSQSYLTVCPCATEREARNVYAYLRTKFVRFLILQTLSGMNLSIDNFKFVPREDFSKAWTDAELYAKYGLTDEEITFIEATIKPMD